MGENYTKVVVSIDPFDMKQQITIFENDKTVNTVYTTLDNLSNTVFGLAKEYDIDEIDLCGNQDFLFKYAAELKTEFTKSKPKIMMIGN